MTKNLKYFLFILIINSLLAQDQNIQTREQCIFSGDPIDLSHCEWYAKPINPLNKQDLPQNFDANLNQGFVIVNKFPLLLNEIFPPKEYGKLRYFILYTKIQVQDTTNQHLVLHFPVIGENYKIYWNQFLLKNEWYIENDHIKKYRTIKDLKIIIDPSYVERENYLVIIIAGYTPIASFNKNDDVGFYLNSGYILEKKNKFFPDIKNFYISFLIGMYLFLGFLLLLFFIFIKNYSFLYLGLFCFDISLYYISGDPILFSYFPQIGSDLLNKIEYSALFLSLNFFIAYIRNHYFYKNLKIFSFFGIYFYFVLLISFINLGIDFKISKLLLIFWQIHAIFIIFYIIILSFIAIIKNKKDSFILFVGILITASSAIYDILASIFLFTSLRITIYLFASFIFILAILLSKDIVNKNKEYINTLYQQKILLQIYKRFFPERILNVIRKEDILDLKFNEFFQLKGIILISDLRDFTHLTEIYGSEKVFQTLNQFYNIIEEMIRDYGGRDNRFLWGSIYRFFPFRK